MYRTKVVMKIVNYIRLLLGAINLLCSIIFIIILIVLFFTEIMETAQLLVMLVFLIYFSVSFVYSVLNFVSKEEINAIKQLKKENVKMELEIEQMALRHQLENFKMDND